MLGGGSKQTSEQAGKKDRRKVKHRLANQAWKHQPILHFPFFGQRDPAF
jgi:hypothetical protein